MSKLFILAVALLVGYGAQVFCQDRTRQEGEKSLIVYFSRTGNTKTVADMIHATVGGDIVELIPAVPYPEEYNQTTRRAVQERDTNARPGLATTIDTMNDYDVVYIGYPIWGGTMPMLFSTFLEQYDFSGKTLIPFCTHGGSSLARSVNDIRRLSPGARVLEGLSVRSASSLSQADIAGWLRRNGISR